MEKNRKIYLVIITTLCMFILFFGWYKTFEQKDVYIDLLTKAAPDSNYAMFVPADTIVIVETAWGDELHTNVLNVPHGDGDYLV